MDNKLLFPSAAVLLHNKKDEPDGTFRAPLLDGSEFSSFSADRTNSQDQNEELSACTGTASLLQSDSPTVGEEYLKNACLYKSSSDSDTSSWESDEYREQRKRKHKKQKKKKKRKHKQKTKKEKYPFEVIAKTKQSNLELQNKPNTIWLDETNFNFSNAFRKDSRPDPNNFEFNCLYKKDIANFFQRVHCQCLGLGKRQSITMYPIKNKRKKRNSIVLKRYFSNVSISFNEETEDKRFIPTVECEDFIPLVKNDNRTMDENKSSNDLSTDSDSFGTSCLERNRYFSEKLFENPADIKTWLMFVDYQDELIMNDDNKKFNTTPKAIIEKKICILEKAMVANPVSTELMIKYMHLVNDIWPHDRIEEKWKQILLKLPNNSTLWCHYLSYLQSDVLTMKISSVIDAYRKCFRMLIGIYNGTECSHLPEENAEEGLLKVFLQMAIFLWQAGHTEKVVSLFQCMVEFNRFSPLKLEDEDDHQKRLSSLGKFFDSDLPRFGETGAFGWNQNTEQLSIRIPCSDSSSGPYTSCANVHFDEELEKLMENKSSKENTWLVLEIIRSINEFLPYRGEEDNCEDTESIVLFDDVSFSLFHLSSVDLKFHLLLAYLFLLGTPLPRRFLRNNIFHCFSAYYVIKECSETSPCFCHSALFNHYVKIDSLLFDKSNRANHKIITEIRSIFSQSFHYLSDKKYTRQISKIWFHFESFLFRYEFEKSVEFEKKYWIGMKKFVKSLLKMVPNLSSVTLWNMYALYEWNIGNLTDAKKVFLLTLQTCHQDKKHTILKVAKTIR